MSHTLWSIPAVAGFAIGLGVGVLSRDEPAPYRCHESAYRLDAEQHYASCDEGAVVYLDSAEGVTVATCLCPSNPRLVPAP